MLANQQEYKEDLLDKATFELINFMNKYLPDSLDKTRRKINSIADQIRTELGVVNGKKEINADFKEYITSKDGEGDFEVYINLINTLCKTDFGTEVGEVEQQQFKASYVPYLIPNGKLNPNSTVRFDKHTYKTDDKGVIYLIDKKLVSKSKYELNTYFYETDDKSRIIRAEGDLKGKNLKPRPKLPDIRDRRLKDDPNGPDDRGHLIAREYGGADTEGNLVPMNAKVNRWGGEYRKLELDLESSKKGHNVYLKVMPVYEDDTNRPKRFYIIYEIDGREFEYSIENEE